ncbi:MAG: gliding motility-associated-like protein [Flavobacteriales bacterium]|jgi:gliding motility-associated-like protein
MKAFTFFKRLCLVVAVFSFNYTSAQLNLDFELTPEEMAQNLVGVGVEIFNVQVTAADSSYAYYSSVGTELGTSEGILLTTGRALNAIGPNDETGLPILDGPDGCGPASTCDLYDNDFPGSDLLTLANGGLTTWDATTFEFNIVPQGDSLKFGFVFASEEYLEWVGSSFNDVFGFFISGPGIGVDVNIALIPGTSDAVAINNVNHIDNSDYFIDNQNPLGQQIQYDGFTSGLVAEIGDLIACEVYTLKLIIADGSDHIYDSGVFVSKIESNPITITTSTVGGSEFMVEGCNNGTVEFGSTFVPDTDIEVNFTLTGDAEFGLDYTTNPDLNLVYDAINDFYTLIILAGETTVFFDIIPIGDGLTEGAELITISLIDQLCDGFQFQSSVDFSILDEISADITPATSTICNGQCVDLIGTAVTEGGATFEWSPLTDLDDPSSLIVEVCPTTTTTYTLSSTLADCVVSASATVTVTEPELIFDVTNITCIDGNSGSIDLTVLDASDPIEYTWTVDGLFLTNAEDPQNLEAGTYCVTIIDGAGCTTSECVDVTEEDVLNIVDVNFSSYTCFAVSCNGACDGSVEVTVIGGTGIYTYEWIDELSNSVGSDAEAIDLCAGDYTVTVTDDNGCTLTETFTVTEPEILEIQVVGGVDILCNGEETGIATVTSTGGCAPYFYDWSHDPDLSTPVASDLGAGNYTATVSDVNGCLSAGSVDININAPSDPINVTIDNVSVYPGGFNVSCPDAMDGQVDITITGGTPGYFAVWQNQQTGNTYFIEDLTNVECGVYDLTITDDNECVFTDTVELTCVPDWNVTADVVPNPCGDDNAGLAEIALTISGSHGGPFTVDWTGPSCPCVGADITGLDSGTYTATITDVLGCEFDFTVVVGANDSFTVNATITPADCGNAFTGSIEVDISPSAVDETSWTGPNGFVSSDEDIFDLEAGTYTLTVIAGTCIETFVFILAEPLPIEVDFIDIVPPICFGQNNGSVTADASGGDANFTYEWMADPTCFFAGSSDSEINSLFECWYIVEVTDGTGCIVQDSIFLDAPQVMDIFVSTTVYDGGFNISCIGENDGEISVSVSGGTPDCLGFDPECYNYDWSGCDGVNIPGSSFQDGLTIGTYCVIVTDSNGCVATTQIPLLEPEQIESSGAISDYNGFGVSCFGECDGFITPNVIGGSGSYVVFEWIAGDIGDNDPEATTLIDLCPGIYELRIVDTNDCEDILTFELTEPTELEVTVDSVVDVSCFEYTDGSTAVTATGGVGGYDYNWNNGEYVGNVLANLGADTLNLVVTDLNGCTAEEQVIILQPDTFLVNLSIPNLEGVDFDIPCVGDSTASILAVIQGGVPDFDVIWSGDGIENINSLNQQNLPAGTYEIAVTDSDGCITTNQVTIDEPDEELQTSSALTPIVCFGECTAAIDLTVTGGVDPYTFLWELNNDGGEFAVSEDIQDLCAGLYEVLVSDANGCDTLLIFEIGQPTQIQLNATFSEYASGTNISCFDACDGSITIAPSGGTPNYTNEWFVNGNPAGNGLTLENICGDDVVSVIVTDDAECSIEQIINLNVPDPLAFNEVVSQIQCNGEMNGAIDLNISGGTQPYTITWTPESGNSEEISGLGEGEYCAQVVDANGCTIDACWTIVDPEELTGTLTGTEASCSFCNGTITLSNSGGTGDVTIIWAGPTFIEDDETNPIDLCEGDYTAIVTDESGCSISIDFTVGGDPGIAADLFATNPLCFDDCDGSVTVAITQSGPNPVIVWTDANGDLVGTELEIDGICNGTFTLSITDDNGCTFEETVTVSEPSEIIIDVVSPLFQNGYNVSEFEGNDGEIETDVSGGTPDYDYIWTGPTSIEDGMTSPIDLTAGTYVLTVTDANGCSKDTTIVLTQPDDLALPTGLSPNGDNANDTYVILGVAEHPVNTFKVFNRWGNIVYEKPNYNNEWDGRNNDGEDLPDGTYFVVFEASSRQFGTYVDLRR